MEELLSNPLALGGTGAALFAALTILAKFKGWLTFDTDQSQFRADLMAQIAAERAQSSEIAEQLFEANQQLREITLEQMRLRVVTDAIRSQMRSLLGVLQDVKDGRIQPEHIQVPTLPPSILGDE